MTHGSTSSGWVLDKRITVTLIFLVISYCASAISWVVYTQTRLSHIEEQISDNPVIIERLAKIEENLKYHTQTLSRIERILEKQ